MTPRSVKEGRQLQGVDEQIIYSLTTTPWGSTPSAVAVAVKDASNAYTNVTTTVMPTGTPSANGDIITLPALKLLTEGHLYRIEVKFTSGSNVYECWFEVQAEL